MALPIWAAIAGLGALKGGLDASSNRKKSREHDAYRRKAIELSPWTGMADPGAANFGSTDFLGGAIGGGFQGAMAGQALGNLGGLGASPAIGANGAARTFGNTESLGAKIEPTLINPTTPGAAGQFNQMNSNVMGNGGIRLPWMA